MLLDVAIFSPTPNDAKSINTGRDQKTKNAQTHTQKLYVIAVC